MLWNEIRSLRRSANAALRHEAWLEFLSIRKSPSEFYTEYPNRLDAAYAKIERIPRENQTSTQRSSEPGLPFDDHIRQTLTTQSSLTLAKATEACVRFDTGHKIHPADAGSTTANKSSH